MLKAGIISLGCPRNLIDSEIIAGSLKKSGMKIVSAERGVDVCVINTCAFTQSAREESIDKIMEASYLKKKGKIGCLVITGCLPQMYKGSLAKELGEADLIVGTNDFLKIPELLKRHKLGAGRTFVSGELDYIYNEFDPRIILTPEHYAYVKISEGCSNFCSYCIIPHLRGKFRSRRIESVEAEFRQLSAGGKLKEVNIIGQDTTLYGKDIYGKIKFPELLRRLCRIKNSVRWIRILYTHPAHYSDELIEVVREEDRMCKYLDIPVQHISDRILKKMNRPTAGSQIEKLIDKLRKKIPGIALRTSLIVGFPGETEKDFNKLLDFVRKARFERLGAFMYSREEGTRAAFYGSQIPEKLKRQRFDAVMKLQQSISREINSAMVGKTVEVLIDEKLQNDLGKYAGRTQADAPEIDGTIYVSAKNLRPGSFCKLKVTGFLEYDLIGEKV